MWDRKLDNPDLSAPIPGPSALVERELPSNRPKIKGRTPAVALEILHLFEEQLDLGATLRALNGCPRCSPLESG